jgi:cell division protein FtsB
MSRSGKERRRRFPFFALLLVGALAVTLAGIFPFRQIIAQERAVDVTRQKLDALRQENQLLQESVELLETPDEVERLAREEFGYVRAGETAFVVVTPVDAPSPIAVSEAPEVLERGNWWDGLVDFFTGRDLDP